MRPAIDTPRAASQVIAPADAMPAEPLRNVPSARWRSMPLAPMALTGILTAFIFCPPVRDNPRMVWTYIGVAGGLFAWELGLWLAAIMRGRAFTIEFVPVKSHYVQACVQFSIMLYWGWFWRDEVGRSIVYAELPMVVSQVLYLYCLDALLSWTRGRTWRMGFGPLPIVISTNLLLWFKHDWYMFQFVMLTIGVLGKQFITWNRDGRRTHIFNPSAFGQSVVAFVLIAIAGTNEYTVGKQIAASFETPHMLIIIFLGGLVVQYLFHVTLMTLAACATLVLINLIYTQVTGVYVFVNVSIAAPIFLGLHLLVTDPATSPRTNLGRVIFGVLYGLGYAILFRVLDLMEVPLFWDKLLPVPFLNLCVPMIDRLMKSGIVGRVNKAWETALKPNGLNLVHMGVWAMLFGTLILTGFIEAPHPGNSIPFWKQAYVDGKAHAGHSLVLAAGSQAEGGGSPSAYNELGLICMEGRIVTENRANAAYYFAEACKRGNTGGCANVAAQHLFLGERVSDDMVEQALEHLERTCDANAQGINCYLIGFAYETGRGRPMNKARAFDLYARYGVSNPFACKGMARVALGGNVWPTDLTDVVQGLESLSASGDGEACWYLAYMHQAGMGVPANDRRARALFEKACELGIPKACEINEQSVIPRFSRPPIAVPGWSTDYPLP